MNLSTTVRVEVKLLLQSLDKVVMLLVDAKEKERTLNIIRAELKLLLLWLVGRVRTMQNIVIGVGSLHIWLKNALRKAT